MGHHIRTTDGPAATQRTGGIGPGSWATHHDQRGCGDEHDNQAIQEATTKCHGIEINMPFDKIASLLDLLGV